MGRIAESSTEPASVAHLLDSYAASDGGGAKLQPTGEVVAVVQRSAGDIVACLAEADERALLAAADSGAGRSVTSVGPTQWSKPLWCSDLTIDFVCSLQQDDANTMCRMQHDWKKYPTTSCMPLGWGLPKESDVTHQTA